MDDDVEKVTKLTVFNKRAHYTDEVVRIDVMCGHLLIDNVALSDKEFLKRAEQIYVRFNNLTPEFQTRVSGPVVLGCMATLRGVFDEVSQFMSR